MKELSDVRHLVTPDLDCDDAGGVGGAVSEIGKAKLGLLIPSAEEALAGLRRVKAGGYAVIGLYVARREAGARWTLEPPAGRPHPVRGIDEVWAAIQADAVQLVLRAAIVEVHAPPPPKHENH